MPTDNRIHVESSAYERLELGEYAVITAKLPLKVGDPLGVVSSVSGYVLYTTVTDVVYLEYPPDDCKSYNGFPFCLVRNPSSKKRVFQTLFTLKPVNDTVMKSISLIGKWRRVLENQADLVKLIDIEFQNQAIQGEEKLPCHLHKYALDDDEFCALNEEEQIACLEQLARAIYAKILTYRMGLTTLRNTINCIEGT
jgi:hypothetical protein